MTTTIEEVVAAVANAPTCEEGRAIAEHFAALARAANEEASLQEASVEGFVLGQRELGY